MRALALSLNISFGVIRVRFIQAPQNPMPTGINLMRDAIGIMPYQDGEHVGDRPVSRAAVILVHEVESHYVGPVVRLNAERGDIAVVVESLAVQGVSIPRIFPHGDVAIADAVSAATPVVVGGGSTSSPPVRDVEFYYQELMDRRGLNVEDLIREISRLPNTGVFKLVDRLCAGRTGDREDTTALRREYQAYISSAAGTDRTKIIGDGLALKGALTKAINIMMSEGIPLHAAVLQHFAMSSKGQAGEILKGIERYKATLIEFLKLLLGPEDYLNGYLDMQAGYETELWNLLTHHIGMDEGQPSAGAPTVQLQEAIDQGLAVAIDRSGIPMAEVQKILKVKISSGEIVNVSVIQYSPVLHLYAHGASVMSSFPVSGHPGGGPDDGGGGAVGGAGQSPDGDGRGGGLSGLNVSTTDKYTEQP